MMGEQVDIDVVAVFLQAAPKVSISQPRAWTKLIFKNMEEDSLS